MKTCSSCKIETKFFYMNRTKCNYCLLKIKHNIKDIIQQPIVDIKRIYYNSREDLQNKKQLTASQRIEKLYEVVSQLLNQGTK